MEIQNSTLNFSHTSSIILNSANTFYSLIKRKIKKAYKELETLGSAAGYAIRR